MNNIEDVAMAIARLDLVSSETGWGTLVLPKITSCVHMYTAVL